MTNRSRLAHAIATGAGVGFWPWGPGTAGSLLAVALAYAVPPVWATVALFLPGVWASGQVAVERNRKDPQIVVIDELLGQWVALLPCRMTEWPEVVGAFLLFRALDMGKPWPIGRMERLPGGWGIVMDDIAAGAGAAFVLLGWQWFNRIS